MTFPLILASSSPRRTALLHAAGVPHDVLSREIDEAPRPDEDGVTLALRLAEEKARATAQALRSPALVLAADTVVVLDGELLGKPRSPADAREMLSRLAGRGHEVVTAFALLRSDDPAQRIVQAIRTAVRFRPLGPREIAAYVATGEPLDKAGAYGIQGRGAGLVLAIQGSYTNVVGLPLAEVLEALATLGGPLPFSTR